MCKVPVRRVHVRCCSSWRCGMPGAVQQGEQQRSHRVQTSQPAAGASARLRSNNNACSKRGQRPQSPAPTCRGCGGASSSVSPNASRASGPCATASWLVSSDRVGVSCRPATASAAAAANAQVDGSESSCCTASASPPPPTCRGLGGTSGSGAVGSGSRRVGSGSRATNGCVLLLGTILWLRHSRKCIANHPNTAGAQPPRTCTRLAAVAASPAPSTASAHCHSSISASSLPSRHTPACRSKRAHGEGGWVWSHCGVHEVEQPALRLSPAAQAFATCPTKQEFET